MDRAQSLLQSTFKLTRFRPGQEAVVGSLLAGRSALAIFPTGGGKSLCYQLPALMLEGLTLVVSPLVALMKDQVDRLNELNVPAARLDSSLSGEETKALYRDLDAGNIKLLYVAPERLTNERFLARLKRLDISLMAVDEAHCVSEWGHNFRPDYLKLAELPKTLNITRVLALTATATPKVAEQICSSFSIAGEDHIQTGFYRPNLSIGVLPCERQERDQRLLECLSHNPGSSTIVYVTLQKTAEAVANLLRQQGMNAEAYHAGLKDDLRHARQEAFMRGDTDIMVATVAFGMGIDKADIRAIYHYNLPKSLENYMQEIGRAGRDGQPSHCVLLACRDDLTVLENFTYGDTPDPQALAELMQWLQDQPERFDLAVYELSQRFDVRPLVLNTLLTYLELEGIIHATSPFYTEYKIAFSQPRDQVLQRFDPARADFLKRLFDTGKTGRTWLTLKPQAAAQQMNEAQPRIVKALNYLEQQELIRLQVAGVRQGYKKLGPVIASPEMIERMNKLFSEREQRDIQRLQTLCNWSETQDCLQQRLMAYFGETLNQPCGGCSACQGKARPVSARAPQKPDLHLIQTLLAEAHPALVHPRPLARFLCGITSPKASRTSLGKHPNFGSMIEVPFSDVLRACDRLMAETALGADL